MASVFEETNRIFLGMFDLPIATPPAGVPAAGTGVVENIYSYTIAPGLAEAETPTLRFRVLEVRLVFATDRTQVDLVPYYSRVNPAPLDRSLVTDSVADAWGSAGGQLVTSLATVSGGNTVEIAARGAKFIYLEGQNQDGTTGAITAFVYGLLSATGGGW